MEICMLCTVMCVPLECDVFDADLLFSFSVSCCCVCVCMCILMAEFSSCACCLLAGLVPLYSFEARLPWLIAVLILL